MWWYVISSGRTGIYSVNQINKSVPEYDPGVGESLLESCGQVVIVKSLLLKCSRNLLLYGSCLSPSLHRGTAPGLALWAGVCFHILPKGNIHHPGAIIQAECWGNEGGLCFWAAYFLLSLIFWFLSCCQENSNEVTCLLLWYGSCHLAGQVGSQLGWKPYSSLWLGSPCHWNLRWALNCHCTGCETLGKILHFSRPQFPDPSSGEHSWLSLKG